MPSDSRTETSTTVIFPYLALEEYEWGLEFLSGGEAETRSSLGTVLVMMTSSRADFSIVSIELRHSSPWVHMTLTCLAPLSLRNLAAAQKPSTSSMMSS